VAELSMGGALFHLHEEGERASSFSPEKLNGTTATIGLFVPDVDKILGKAEAAGATITQPAQDYDYGYRQGKFRDPFGHLWLIEKKI
jgi:PhnB protein